jgi:hypothetical protein
MTDGESSDKFMTKIYFNGGGGFLGALASIILMLLAVGRTITVTVMIHLFLSSQLFIILLITIEGERGNIRMHPQFAIL